MTWVIPISAATAARCRHRTLTSLPTADCDSRQFYNTARCCPSRASLLTGLHPHQTGVGHMTADDGLEGYRGSLNRRCVTIAEALGATGYRTYMSGKWHISRHIQPEGAETQLALPSGDLTDTSASSRAPRITGNRTHSLAITIGFRPTSYRTDSS